MYTHVHGALCDDVGHLQFTVTSTDLQGLELVSICIHICDHHGTGAVSTKCMFTHNGLFMASGWVASVALSLDNACVYLSDLRVTLGRDPEFALS